MKYKFVGNGAGVPGLPNEVTEADIASFNGDQLAVWNEALSSGVYVESVTSRKSKKPIDEGEVKTPKGDKS